MKQGRKEERGKEGTELEEGGAEFGMGMEQRRKNKDFGRFPGGKEEGR